MNSNICSFCRCLIIKPKIGISSVVNPSIIICEDCIRNAKEEKDEREKLEKE